MQSVTRSLQVLEAVADHQPVGVTELAKRLDLPTSTVQRILVTLNGAGWIAASGEPQTRWTMTARAAAIGQKSTHGQNLLEASARALGHLRDATQETVHLGVPDGDQRFVVIHRVDSHQALRTYIPFGHSSPLHVTASGQCILAAFPDAAIDIVASRPLESVTETTITTSADLRHRIASIRRAGYGYAVDEASVGVAAIAAAITDATGQPIAAVAISMPTTRFDQTLPPAWGPLAVRAASSIAQELAN
jgi:IclR family acetate operon transcriptional repressor